MTITSSFADEVVCNGSYQTGRQKDSDGSWLAGPTNVDFDREFNLGRYRNTSENENWLSRLRNTEVVIGPYATNGVNLPLYVGASGEYGEWGGTGYTDVVKMTNVGLLDQTDIGNVNFPSPGSLEDKAVIAATRAQSAMVEGAAMTAVSLLEAGSTIKMVLMRLRQLLQILQAARRSIRNGRGINDIRDLLYRRGKGFEDAMSAWMEFRYGWRPLVGDIEDHVEAIDKILDPPDKLYNASAREDASQLETVEDVFLGKLVPTGGWVSQINCYGDVYRTPKRFGALAKYFYKLDPSQAHRALYWLGVQTPAMVLFEILPYSFVLNWFSNLQSYLTAISSIPVFLKDPIGFLSKSQTFCFTASGKRIDVPGGSALKVDTVKPGWCIIEEFGFTREVITPGDYVGLRWDIELDVFKAVDAAIMCRNLAHRNREDARRSADN